MAAKDKAAKTSAEKKPAKKPVQKTAKDAPRTTAAKSAKSAKPPAGKKSSAAKAKQTENAKKVGVPAARGSGPVYWLFKSEPDVFSWEMLKAKGKAGEQWDGVRNYLARNNMRAMQLGDLGFFYHSNEGKEVVGICEVCALAHPDTTTDDERWECVDVRAVADVATPVSLAAVKDNPKLAEMALVTSMRLSVQPVTPAEWKEVCRMAGVDPSKIEGSAKK